MIPLNQPLDDPNSEEAKEFLGDIQGNILKGHGRNFAVHLLLRFKFKRNNKPAVKAARQWLANFANTTVTSALRQHQDTEEFKNKEQEPGYSEKHVAMLLLTAEGYSRLDFAQKDIPNDPHNRFMEGMGYPHRIRKDGNKLDWEPPYDEELHAMILLAHNDEEWLKGKIESIQRELDLFCLIHSEWGYKLKKGNQVIEQFGYADGISQPLFFKKDIDDEKNKRGSDQWDPSAPLDLVLIEENSINKTYGSFMVFRKLEQKVTEFNDALEKLADTLKLAGEEERAKAGALAVGRFKDGRPVFAATAIVPTEPANNFTFNDDSDGMKCPFHAHIRKTNPRGEFGERIIRIVRRGITYGRTQKQLDDNILPPTSVGLLFISFQAQLRDFEIQQIGSDNEAFPNKRPKPGLDPVIGRGPTKVKQRWPSNNTQKFKLADFVIFKGGEYFFAPSMTMLKRLKDYP